MFWGGGIKQIYFVLFLATLESVLFGQCVDVECFLSQNKAITKGTWNHWHSTCIFTAAPTDCKRAKLPFAFWIIWNSLSPYLTAVFAGRLTADRSPTVSADRVSFLQKHSHQLRQTLWFYQDHPTFPSACARWSWLICTSTSTCWTAADRLATALHSCIQNEWAGCESAEQSSLLIPLLPIFLHFQALVYVFSTFPPVSLSALWCNQCVWVCVL